MSDHYSRGGILPPHPSLGGAEVDDDECILGRDLTCQRTDERHYREPIEVRTLGGATVRRLYGPCVHRHTAPVEAGGELVARLCLHCDEQLLA